MSDDVTLPDIELYRGAIELGSPGDVDAAFRDRNMHTETHSPGRPGWDFLGGTMLTLNPPNHAGVRKQHAALFRREALEFYETQVIQSSIERCLTEHAAHRNDDGVVRADLVEACREMLSDMAVRLIGLGTLDDADRRAQFMALHEDLMLGVALAWMSDHPDFATLRQQALAGKQRFWDEWVEPSWLERRRHDAEGSATSSGDDALDLLGLLAALPEIDDEAVLRDCIMYAVGSISTTTQAVVHTYALLTDWFVANPDRWSDRLDTAFLRRASAEGLRLHPPVPSVLRRAASDATMPSGLEVHTEDVLALHMTRANRDETTFGQCPRDMDPDRDVVQSMKPYGSSFGGGRHLCIGRPVALPLAADGTSTTKGAMVRMLEALYTAGVEPDPNQPRSEPESARQDFVSFPVVFTAP